MNIVFLGVSSEDKKFVILCLAKIISCYKNVVIYSTTPYGCTNEKEYDYCGVEIYLIDKDAAIEPLLKEDTINLIDVEEYISFDISFKAVAICEIPRSKLERTLKLVNEFAWKDQSLDIVLVYLNILEYCKINEKYLDLYWEKELLSFANILQKCIFIFDETDRIIMVETQFNERLSLKSMTKSFKSSLMEMAKVLLDLELKEIRKIFRKAERVK